MQERLKIQSKNFRGAVVERMKATSPSRAKQIFALFALCLAEMLARTRYDDAMDERDFYTERPETKTAEYMCPRCKRSNQYQVRWMRRTKKDRLPPRADERDRALFGKLRNYLIRIDDDVTCKTCQKRFEIPSFQSMVYLDEPSSSRPPGNDDDDNRGNRA